MSRPALRVALSMGFAATGVACAALLSVDDVAYVPGAADAYAPDVSMDGASRDGPGSPADGAPDSASRSDAAPSMCLDGTKACAGGCVGVTVKHGCSDPASCAECPVGPSSTPICDGDSGSCALQCAAGFVDCNRDASDGCEAQPEAGDQNNCGACGVHCSGDAGLCSGSSCVATCPAGEQPCQGTSCADVDASTLNCGACGKVCPSGPDGTATCTSGKCDFTCFSSFANCDNDASNGCECNPPPGAAAGCSATTCQFLCLPNFTACSDGSCCDPLNGSICLVKGGCGSCIPLGMSACGGDSDCCDPGAACNTADNQCCYKDLGHSCAEAADCCSGKCAGLPMQCN